MMKVFDALYKIIEKFAILTNVFSAILIQTFIQIIQVMVMAPKMEQYASGSMLDLRIYYSGSDAMNYLKDLGLQGRNLYLIAEIIDLIYPFAYTAAFMLLLVYLGRYAFPSNQVKTRILVIPVALFCIDYMENITIIINILSFPAEHFFYLFSGYFTILKYIFLLINMGVLSFFALVALKRELM